MHPKLNLCTLDQLDELLRISKKTFIDAFEHQNDPGDFKTYIDKAFSKEQLKKEIKEKDSEFYLVELNGEIAGYFKLNENEAQTDVKAEDSLEVERIYVDQKFQGLKLGHWMMEEIKKIGHTKKKNFLWLGVWEHNTRAINFYIKNGFAKFGEHPYFIGKDKQMDWLMRCDLVTLQV